MHALTRGGIVAVAMLIVAACQSPVEQTGPNQAAGDVADRVPVKIVYNNDQCLSDIPKVDLIADPDSLDAWWKSMTSGFLPAPTIPGSLASIDLARNSLLVISMGTRPTPGFGMQLAKNYATAESTMLVIQTVWQSPPENVMLAQRLTKPCIAVSLTIGSYERVRVVDQYGQSAIEQSI